jgi:tRNA(Arg) A34 adenosine deaminase TadA
VDVDDSIHTITLERAIMLIDAIEKARQIPKVKGQRRVYCIITDKRGRIVAEASNSYTQTHPFQKQMCLAVGFEDKEFLHAETAAIIKARGKGSILYVARVDARGRPQMSKPCKMCSEAIRLHGNIKEIHHT